MPTTISKLFPTGILQVRGELDELTYGSIKIGSTGTYASLFDEVTYNTTSGVVKNLLSWSEYFTAWSAGDQSGWFYNASPNQITFNAIPGPAPGTLAGKLIDMPAALGSQIHRIYCNWAQFVTGRVYTLSIYAKAAERTQFILFHEETAGRVGINVDLSAGTKSDYIISPTSSFITPVGNGWYRVGFTFTATQTGSSIVDLCRLKDGGGNPTYIGDGASGLYLWGAQLEESSTATLYQGNGASANPYVAGNKATPLTPTFTRRDANNGNLYVTGFFDEYTISPGFIQATGGTISTYTSSSTNYKTHTFISSVSTFTVTTPGTVDIVLVGGGGGGSLGYNSGPFHSPGNGGDGGTGLSTSTYLEPGLYTISVGNGGSFGFNASNFNGQPGGTTTALGFTAVGGGGGSSTRLNQAGTTNGILSSISGSSIQYGQGGPITPGTVVGASGTNGTGNGGASGGDGNFSGGQGGTGVVIIRYVTQ